MMTRSFVKEHAGRCLHPSVLVLSVLAAVTLTLQGCDGQTHTLGKRNARKPKIEPPVVLVSPVEKPKQEVEQLNIIENWQPAVNCDSIFRSKSNEFRKGIQKDAQDYYDGVVNTFTLDFVRFPFCLESNHNVVHPLERKMRALDAFKDMPSLSFEDRLNDTITAQFNKNEGKWQMKCQDWAERNKAHQLSNLPMVRKVIGFSGDDDELKAQIKGFFKFEPWWSFFHDMAKSGCMRQYTQKCVRPAKVAHRHANELVMQTMGDRDMTWHEFNVPSNSLLEAGEKWRHQTPIEVRAGAQQFLPRARPAV